MPKDVNVSSLKTLESYFQGFMNRMYSRGGSVKMGKDQYKQLKDAYYASAGDFLMGISDTVAE